MTERASTISMTSTPIKIMDAVSANEKNCVISSNPNSKLNKKMAPNIKPLNPQNISASSSNNDPKLTQTKHQAIAPSPSKPVLIAAKPSHMSSQNKSSAMNQNIAGAVPNKLLQKNILSAAQLQQQQQQYIIQQQFQQQVAAYQQRIQSQQQQQQQNQQQQQTIYMNNINEGNLRTNQSLTTQLLVAAIKQQQQINTQNPSISVKTENNGKITIANGQQIPTQQLLQYISANNNSQIINQDAGSQKQIAPKAQIPLISNLGNFVNQTQQVTLNNNKSKDSIGNQMNFNSTQSANQPTIYAATTNASGQLVFQTVDPSTANPAALNAAAKFAQQQQMNSQAQEMQQKLLLPSNSYQSNNKKDASYMAKIKNADGSMSDEQLNEHNTTKIKQQEILKQKLLQEELKYQKLQYKLDQLTTNKKIVDGNSNSINKNSDEMIKNIMSNEINNMNNISEKYVKISPNNKRELTSDISVCDNSKLDDSTKISPHSQVKTKRRGRPRLYEIDPITGKSMKDKPLPDMPKRQVKRKQMKENSENNSNQIIFQPNINSYNNVVPTPCHIISENINENRQQVEINQKPFVSDGTTNHQLVSANLENQEKCEIANEHIENDEEMIEIDLNNDHDNHDKSELSYSSESENENNLEPNVQIPMHIEKIQKCEEDLFNEKSMHIDQSSNNVKEEFIEKATFSKEQYKRIEGTIEDTIEAVINDQRHNRSNDSNGSNDEKLNNSTDEQQINNDLKSPIPIPSSASHSTSSLRSSRSSSSSSLNSSTLRKNNSNLIENVKGIYSIPPGIQNNVILTHIIEGCVIKESSMPFPVKQHVETAQDLNNKISDLDETDLKQQLERLQNDRKKLLESLEKSIDLTHKHSSPTNSKCIRESPKRNADSQVKKEISDIQDIKQNSEAFIENTEEKVCKTGEIPNKKIRKSTDNEIFNEDNRKVLNYLEDTTNSIVNNANSKTSFNQSFKNQEKFVSQLQKNDDFEKMDTCLAQPQMSRLSISSPKNLPDQSANPISISKINYESEIPPGDPTEWTYDDVYDFVKLVAGVPCAEMFKSQEVDGSALSLIRDDHLVNTMHIKLGPALKIMNKFNEIKNRYYNTVV